MSSSSSPVTNLWPTISQPPYSKYVSYSDDIRIEHKQINRHSTDFFCYRRHARSIRNVAMIVMSFLSGFFTSYFALRMSFRPDGILDGATGKGPDFDQGYSSRWSRRLMTEVSPADIAVNLRNYTLRVHISGTQGNNRLRDFLKSQLSACSRVQVKLFPYNVLLSYHNWEQTNSVSVRDGDGSLVYQTGYRGPPIEDDPHPADHPELTEPYVAYSPNASVQGRLIFALYGQSADFEHFVRCNISLSNSVVLVKLGKLPIINTVNLAEQYGAVGVLLFSASNEAINSTGLLSNASRHTNHLPGWATRRASLRLFGDPLTVGFPSRDFMRRISLIEAKLPQIPVQPIGGDDAEQLIKLLTGSKTAGEISAEELFFRFPVKSNWTVQLDVFNELERREITNVLGVFHGHLEPDRYVIVGCRFDAWTYGGVSPNTGTAVLMELVKALTRFSDEGWSPRRTIIFANWDAGEMGQVGAVEWIEDREQEIIDRAVSYIDLNSAISGNETLLVQASPLIKQLTISSAHSTPYKRHEDTSWELGMAGRWCSGNTIFDAWMCQRPFRADSKIPRFHEVTVDSEHSAFHFYLGIPVIWARFVNLDKDGRPEQHTSVYRTSLDTFEYVHQFVDPSFQAHKTMVGFILDMILQLSTLPRLPLDVHELSITLEEETKTLCQRARYFEDLFDNLASAVYNLTQTTAQFRNKFLELDDKNLLMVRQYNDKVMKFSRSFIGATSLSDQPLFRSILFGPSQNDYNQIRIWPKIQEVLDMTTNDMTAKDFDSLHDRITKEVSVAIATLRSATYILSDDIFL